MKKLIPVFALFILCLYSCKEEAKKANTNSNEVPVIEKPIVTPQVETTESATPQPATNNAAVTNIVGGAHYLCPKNCVGGESSAQGTCPVCSTALAHNQGFHNTNPLTNGPLSTPNITNTTAPTATPASGPNAAGVYHYTCANGCAGGGDALGKCASCAGDLAHNAAYHN